MIEAKSKTLGKNTPNKSIVIRYAWGNQKLSTWFITKSHKEPVPKGSRILFEIHGVFTSENLFTKDTYPKLGDVISDTDGKRIKIKSIKWH